MLLKAFIKGVRQTKKYHDVTWFGAIMEELYMMFSVMGVRLYARYLNGIAEEGVDFPPLEQ